MKAGCHGLLPSRAKGGYVPGISPGPAGNRLLLGPARYATKEPTGKFSPGTAQYVQGWRESSGTAVGPRYRASRGYGTGSEGTVSVYRGTVAGGGIVPTRMPPTDLVPMPRFRSMLGGEGGGSAFALCNRYASKAAIAPSRALVFADMKTWKASHPIGEISKWLSVVLAEIKINVLSIWSIITIPPSTSPTISDQSIPISLVRSWDAILLNLGTFDTCPSNGRSSLVFLSIIPLNNFSSAKSKELNAARFAAASRSVCSLISFAFVLSVHQTPTKPIIPTMPVWNLSTKSRKCCICAMSLGMRH